MRQPIAFVAALFLLGIPARALGMAPEPLRSPVPDRARFLSMQLTQAPLPPVGKRGVSKITSQSIKRVATKLATIETRPKPLVALYGSFIALQALDFDSTRRAIRAGVGREGNPILQGIAGSSSALLAVKVGTTAAVVVAAEKLWRNGHPVAAVVMMVAVNSAHAMVAAHNYSVLRKRG